MIEDTASTFLRGLRHAASETVRWPGDLSFRVQTFVTAEAPPATLLTSARAIVLLGDEVLVVTDRSPSTHILPGGRIEPGEDGLRAVVREVGEETGWEVRPGGQIGVRYLHHLQPRPAAYAFPYPDFFQAVYVAHALRQRPQLRNKDGWETEARFIPVRDAFTLPLSAGEHALLAAALEALQRPSDTSSI